MTTLAANPQLGEKKKGDLAFLRVLKFHMGKQPMLLGYILVEDRLLLVLLALGPHENFFRNVKRG